MIVDQIKAARRVSVPLVAVSTPDQAATMETVDAALNGETPIIQWDCVEGVRPRSQQGNAAIGQTGYDPGLTKAEQFGPVVACCNALALAKALPENTVLYVQNAHRYLDDTQVLQSIWNLRDLFKQDRRMLILLGPDVKLPTELAGDVVALDEPLPDGDRIQQIVQNVHAEAGLAVPEETLPKAVAATTGLPAFQVEQLTAMSLTPDGLVLSTLRESKYREIERCDGLSVYRGKELFDDMGGTAYAKQRFWRIGNGRYRPGGVVVIDEIDKQMVGEGDLSGVSQRTLGKFLTYMEEQKVKGILCVGPPGAGKSLIARALGNELDIPGIDFNAGDMMGSLVGESEGNLSRALKVITSVTNGRPLFVATANSVERLNTALLRRFPLLFFFDLPDKDERAKIWPIHMARLGLEGDIPDDRLWAGADIRNCCESAWEEDVSLIEAAQGIVPVGVRSAKEIEVLRNQANGRYLSAAYPGSYRIGAQDAGRGRRLDLN